MTVTQIPTRHNAEHRLTYWEHYLEIAGQFVDGALKCGTHEEIMQFSDEYIMAFEKCEELKGIVR